VLGIVQAEAESAEADEMKKKLSKTENSAGLAELILHNQQSRGKQMDAFFDDLAAKYGSHDKTSGKKQSAAKHTASKSSSRSKGKK